MSTKQLSFLEEPDKGEPAKAPGRATKQPPLKWHGGKFYLAPKIVELMPQHLHYVEAYAGGLAVLLARDPMDRSKFCGEKSYESGVSEVVNDVDGDLTNFWHVLQNEESFAKFARTVEAIPFSQGEWQLARRDSGDGPVESAVRFFVFCRQSRAGKMKDFATLTRNRTRRAMNEQASAWINCVEGLPAVHARLRKVVVLNDDATKVIKQQDGSKTLFYLDPPYLHETRAGHDDYRFEMSRNDHVELLETLASIEGKFMLSGYSNSMYDEFAHREGWRRVEFELPNNAAAGATKRRMIECLWMNFD